MKRIIFLCSIVTALFYLEACYKEEIRFDALPDDQLELALILELNDKTCFFDNNSKTLRYAIEEDSIQNFTPYVCFQDYSEITVNGIPLINKTTNNFGTIKIKEIYKVQITTKGITNHFTLSFTNLPIVRITTLNQIIDEPKKLARFTINYPSDTSEKTTSFIGIDYRGGSAQFNPKKSYGFSFLQTMDISTKTSKALFNWEKNEDWILDAMFNDQSRLRNKTSFEVWKAMNPLEHEAIQSRFVELYLNNDYQGIYCLNEQMNAERLGLTDLEAVSYKATEWGTGATTFQSLTPNAPLPLDKWDGWEQKYPDPKDRINWQPLYDLIELVVDKGDAEFSAQISTQIDLELLMDYYIFLNLVSGSDNYGKNTIWFRKNAQAPFEISPWDVDASWGRFWDGALMNADIILSNQLFDRLLDVNPTNFKNKLKSRWLALRADVFTYPTIKTRYEKSFKELLKSDILAIENLKWGINLDLQQEQNYINTWTQNRLSFLDTYFANL